MPTKNFLESVFSLAIFFDIHQMHAIESISDKTSFQQDESYMGASENRPHSACNVETWIPQHATTQIGGWARTTSWVGNPSRRDRGTNGENSFTTNKWRVSMGVLLRRVVLFRATSRILTVTILEYAGIHSRLDLDLDLHRPLGSHMW